MIRASRPVIAAAGMVMAVACSNPQPVGPPQVQAAGEVLQGSWVDRAPGVAVFKGIPYAAPPTGAARWRAPGPRSPRAGRQSAAELGPACMQEPGNIDFYRRVAESFGNDPELVPDLEPMSEDCLVLNIWTASKDQDERRPVMVWIHGGSNRAGSGAEPSYDGANLARRGVVVVTINYRLGVFGFLVHPELTAESDHNSSGNYGLLDQIAALRWIQRNISAFGGDPDRVTIFGESAGATDVAYLLTSPLARGLFHRAAIQSGGYSVAEFRTVADLEPVGIELSAAAGVNGGSIADLRAADAEDLLRIAGGMSGGAPNVPAVDGWVLTDPPGRAFDEGSQMVVPLVIGFNADEWTTMRTYWPHVTVNGLREELNSAYGDLAPRALELYQASTDDEAVRAADQWQTDLYFACPSRFIADRMARLSDHVYFYVFTRSLSAPGGPELGAYHGAEVPYVFDNLALESWVPHEPYDGELADAMASYWIQFAASGDPNGDGRPHWPRYEPVARPHMLLGDRIESAHGVREAQCDLFENLQSVRLAGR